MKKGYILIALMVMLVGTGCGYQKDANQGKAVTAETTTDAKKQTLEFYGQVIDGEGEEIFVDFPGYIEKVYVKEGMIVNKGDVLATFNNTDYLAEIAALKSEIAIDEVKLQQLKANVNPLVADIQYTQSQLEQYQVYKSDEDSAELLILKQKLQVKEKELQKEEKTYNDYQALYEVGGIAETELVKVDQNITETKAEIEEIKLQMQQIKDKYSKEIDNLEDKLTSLNQQLDYNQANEVYNLQVAELELKQKNEELKQKESRLHTAHIQKDAIVADQDQMIVYDIQCMNGTRIQDAETTLMKLMNTKDLLVSIHVSMEYSGYVKEGNAVDLEFANNKGNIVKGEVSRISNRATEVNGELGFDVEIKLNEQVDSLRIGTEVVANVYID